VVDGVVLITKVAHGGRGVERENTQYKDSVCTMYLNSTVIHHHLSSIPPTNGTCYC
jgi:hypothetical protein